MSSSVACGFDYSTVSEGLREKVERISAYGANVLYRRAPWAERTFLSDGGVILRPETSFDAPDLAEVVSVGQHRRCGDRFMPATEAQPGDWVVVRQYEDMVCRIEPRTPEGRRFCMTRGTKIEAKVVPQPWNIEYGKLPQALKDKWGAPDKVPQQSLRCFEDYVLIFYDPNAEMTRPQDDEHHKKIAIPEDSQIAMFATVMDVGPGHYREDGVFFATDLKPGEKVLVMPFAGYNQEVMGVEYKMLQVSDTFATWTGEHVPHASIKILRTNETD